MPTKAPPRPKKMKTELGVEIENLPSHQMAEEVAQLREQIEDWTERVTKRLPDLLKAMKADGVTKLSARAPGGSLFTFEAVDLGEKVKITRPKT